MASEVKAFVCDFCPRKKRFAKIGAAKHHERNCFHNPLRKACVTCRFFSKERAEPPDWDGNYPGSPGALICEFDLIPVPAYTETTPFGDIQHKERAMRADCEKWEPKEV